MLMVNQLGGFGAGGGVTTLISAAAGTIIGDMTLGGGNAAAFDGTTSQIIAASAELSGSGNLTGHVGKDWGASARKIISRFRIFAPSGNFGFSNNANLLTFNYKLQGSTDNFSGSIVDLYASSVVSTDAVTVDVTSGILQASFRYHRVEIVETGTPGGGHAIGVAEVQFYEDL